MLLLVLMLMLMLMLIRSTSIASVPFTTGCFKLWYCFWYFYLSTIIPFITKSSMTNIIFKRSAYYLDTLDDSAGDNNDYDTSIMMLLWQYRPIFLSVAGCGDAPLTIQINNYWLWYFNKSIDNTSCLISDWSVISSLLHLMMLILLLIRPTSVDSVSIDRLIQVCVDIWYWY